MFKSLNKKRLCLLCIAAAAILLTGCADRQDDKAKVEYKNYIMLKPDAKNIYMPILDKINYYLNPEAKVIEELSKKAAELAQREKYAEASILYERALFLSTENTPEYSHLKAKHTLCIRKVG